MISELLSSDFEMQKLYIIDSYSNAALLDGIPSDKVVRVSERELKKISSLTSPQQLLAVVDIQNSKHQIDCRKQLVLALDNVKDPGNLGTIIRTADWFGIKQLVCSTDCVDVYNTKVVQASMGSIFRMQVSYKKLSEWLKEQDCTIYGAHLKGKDLWKENLSKSGVLLMGNESKGISEELMELVSIPLKIPSKGKAESLNVAIATAIFCAAFSRDST